MNLRAIAPQRHEKYSPNLYRWLLKRRREGVLEHYATIYRDTEGRLWIGHRSLEPDGAHSFSGCMLNRVLCEGAREKPGCYLHIQFAESLHELPGFWEEYEAEGRCAIDREHQVHFIGDGSRWEVNGDERKCLWCGRVTQHLRRWTEEVERAAWETVTPA